MTCASLHPGGLLGGLLGDWAAARWPNHGRIVVCQLSVGAGVPLSALLFKVGLPAVLSHGCMRPRRSVLTCCHDLAWTQGLPLSAGAWATAQYAAVLVTMGLLITWATPAATNPIFSEIVAPHMRQIVYSFDRSFEGAVAACGAPLVGLLARAAFGFSGAAEVGAPGDDLAKARSLGSALLAFTAVPWTLCVLFFTPLHWTYRRDRQQTEEAAAAAHAAAEALLAEQREAAGIELAEQRPGCSSGDEVKDRLAPTRLEDSVGEGEA